MTSRVGVRASACAIASVVFAAGCMGDAMTSKTDLGAGTDPGDNGASTSALVVTNLASDQPNMANHLGAALVNAWGIVAFDGMFWIANEGSGLVSILDGQGNPATGKVASGQLDLGEGITGVVVNDMTADKKIFPMHRGEDCQPAKLIFASTHGQLIGVNPDLDATGGFVLVDRSKEEAAYLGVAIIHTDDGPRILAADFHNARIDVFDADFALVTTLSFVAPEIPAGFAPFNVMAFDDKVFVTYAQQDEDKQEEVIGPGLGFVAVFDTSGTLLGTIKGEQLNAPWGMAMAGKTGPFPGALLVGNFGDGRINAIDLEDMTILGQLMGNANTPIAVEGLWGIAFGAGVSNARPDGLYFAAGPDDEEHGLFGVIAPPTR